MPTKTKKYTTMPSRHVMRNAIKKWARPLQKRLKNDPIFGGGRSYVSDVVIKLTNELVNTTAKFRSQVSDRLQQMLETSKLFEHSQFCGDAEVIILASAKLK